MARALDVNAAPIGYHQFCRDVSINFQCNRWLQWIGPRALPELRGAVTARTNYPSLVDAFTRLADQARGQGRRLDAAYYDRAADFYLEPGDPRRPELRQDPCSALCGLQATTAS